MACDGSGPSRRGRRSGGPETQTGAHGRRFRLVAVSTTDEFAQWTSRQVTRFSAVPGEFGIVGIKLRQQPSRAAPTGKTASPLAEKSAVFSPHALAGRKRPWWSPLLRATFPVWFGRSDGRWHQPHRGPHRPSRCGRGQDGGQGNHREHLGPSRSGIANRRERGSARRQASSYEQ